MPKKCICNALRCYKYLKSKFIIFEKMITKSQIITALDKLPESMSIDQLIDHLIFVEKVEKGLKDSKEGNVYTKEEAKQKLSKWLK